MTKKKDKQDDEKPFKPTGMSLIPSFEISRSIEWCGDSTKTDVEVIDRAVTDLLVRFPMAYGGYGEKWVKAEDYTPFLTPQETVERINGLEARLSAAEKVCNRPTPPACNHNCDASGPITLSVVLFLVNLAVILCLI